MRKSWTILVIVVVAAAFAMAVFFGIRRARGVPVAVGEEQRPLLAVQRLPKNIDLNGGIDLNFWQTIEPLEIDLRYQVMVLPWPKKVVPFVRVKSFHNGEKIFFYLEWQDGTKNTRVEIGNFSDAGAVMFPLDEKAPSSTLMMGFMGQANIWQWKASQDSEFWTGQREEKKVYVDFHYPFEEQELFVISKDPVRSAANDLISARIATVTLKTKQMISGRGSFENGIWRVVLVRAMKTDEPRIDVQFDESPILCAFAVWEGSNRDRGGRKSISNWVELSIQ